LPEVESSTAVDSAWSVWRRNRMREAEAAVGARWTRERGAGEARGQLEVVGEVCAERAGRTVAGDGRACWRCRNHLAPVARAARECEQERARRREVMLIRLARAHTPTPRLDERDPTERGQGGGEDAPADARASHHLAVVRALDLLGDRAAAGHLHLVGLLLLDGEALLLLLLEAREVVLALLRDHVARDDVGAHAERLRVVRLPRAVAARRDVAVTCRVRVWGGGASSATARRGGRAGWAETAQAGGGAREVESRTVEELPHLVARPAAL